MRVQVTDSQIRSWRLRGFTLERIARACGSTTSAISHRIQRIWQEELERAAASGDPDETEILRRCAEIQQGWSERERQKREVGRAKSWRPDAVPVSIRELVHD
jgi:hypothetical protein